MLDVTSPVSLPCFCCLQDVPFILNSLQHFHVSHNGKMATHFIMYAVYYFLFSLQPKNVVQSAETCTYIDVLIK